METLQERLARLAGAAPLGPVDEDLMAWAPAIDLEEAENEFVMTAELPGITDKDVTVSVEENTLVIRGEKKTEREERKGKNGRWHIAERSWGAFERSFTLPNNVDPSNIEAEFAEGVLTLHLPKRSVADARRIPISGKGARGKR
jgi:HSP20 family protein